MESTIGLLKTELIKPGRPWKTLAEVELATAEWIDWYNHRRLHGEIGDNAARDVTRACFRPLAHSTDAARQRFTEDEPGTVIRFPAAVGDELAALREATPG